jgi:hypothetical protein
MNLVYNSEHYSVVAFSPLFGFEVLDKDARRTLFVHGVVAQNFAAMLNRIPQEDRNEETMDELLDDFCAGSAQPIVFH